MTDSPAPGDTYTVVLNVATGFSAEVHAVTDSMIPTAVMEDDYTFAVWLNDNLDEKSSPDQTGG